MKKDEDVKVGWMKDEEEKEKQMILKSLLILVSWMLVAADHRDEHGRFLTIRTK